MSKSTKRDRTARVPKPSPAPVVVTTPDAPAPVVVTTPDAAPVAPAPFALRDVVPDVAPDARIPACIDSYVAGFRAIAGMPVVTTDERIAASRAFTSAAFPNDEWTAVGGTSNACRSDIGTGIMDVQNAVYVAAVLSNVRLHNHHIASAWASIFPNARCGRNNPDARNVPYVSAKTCGYPLTGTLSAFRNANNGHAGTGLPGIPGGRTLVTEWAKRIDRAMWAAPYVPPVATA